ncbi:MAG: glycogen debranching protein GlgX [Candidatus Accumulibacter sp.]|jgi:glycogen operon protein|nr:glycogen debranching protein GlgX [Accumulibacter sp.]
MTLPVLLAGRPWPLGAHWDGEGVNFALFSAHADRVELCLWAGEALRATALPACTDQVWHGYLPGAGPGLAYAFRVHGPVGPGHRFDPACLLVDPYARELAGDFFHGQAHSSARGLRARVVDPAFDWGDDAPPGTPLKDSVFYEVHVKGATRLHPGVPEALRGTYAGLAAPPMLEHFRRLGVTAVNLLPVQAFLDEQRLFRMGLANYWGYNTLAFFAPEPRYAARVGGQPVLDEFRSMVRSLHTAGIEVILDVVYNHTAETDEFGPTISFRGIDNASYYRLAPDNPDRYENFSGCGNTFHLGHPRVLQLVMDSLRHWAGEMRVDGFRFDLATALTRDSAFLAALAQDPVLARVKRIAEPWDLGPDGYRLGSFPPGWSEWNDRFRDDVRAFWLTGDAGAGQLAQRLAGSSEVFRHDGRAPSAGVNFVTAHDGFTLRDLVSYREKHNEANGERNRDGNDRNFSCNCGVEGESDDPRIVGRRRGLQRALLATLFAAQGVPMLQGGDELGRTQAGNNNAYCQDNALTWLDWPNADQSLIEFAAGLSALRKRFGQFRRADWLTGAESADGARDVLWWHPDGRQMREPDWNGPPGGTLGMLLSPALDDPEPAALLALFNRAAAAVAFRLPPGAWRQVCDSGAGEPFHRRTREGICAVPEHSVVLLAQDRGQKAEDRNCVQRQVFFASKDADGKGGGRQG